MPEIIQSTSHSFKSGGSGVACLRTSQENEGLEPSAPLGFTQRRINMRSTTNILPHDRTRYSGKIKKQMLYHGLSCLAVIFGILLASPTIAAAPQPDVRKLVTEHLSDLQEQWTANEKNYLEEQKRIHDLAEKARKTLCEVGEVQNCASYIKARRAPFNLNRLAIAIATAETSDCTAGVGASKNNCFGIRDSNGFKYFATPEQSYAVFKEFWPRIYGDHFPTIEDAQMYVSSNDVSDWLSTVVRIYNK